MSKEHAYVFVYFEDINMYGVYEFMTNTWEQNVEGIQNVDN